MKRIMISLLSIAVLVSALGLSAFAASEKPGEDSCDLYDPNTGILRIHCTNELSVSSAIDTSGYYSQKNNYSKKVHNCLELNIFTSAGRTAKADYSDTDIINVKMGFYIYKNDNRNFAF